MSLVEAVLAVVAAGFAYVAAICWGKSRVMESQYHEAMRCWGKCFERMQAQNDKIKAERDALFAAANRALEGE